MTLKESGQAPKLAALKSEPAVFAERGDAAFAVYFRYISALLNVI